MTKEIKTILNDEILHFLYSNAAFQQLSEEAQLTFLQTFKYDELFKEIAETAISLQETISEVEATMPKIQNKDFLMPHQEHRRLLKERTKIEGNVYFFPFDELQNLYSPYIICIQQSDTMSEFEAFSKGMLLPLFNLCTRQKRDLIIIPFGEKVGELMVFEYGHMNVADFMKFVHETEVGDASIVPAMRKAIALLAEDTIKHNPEVMIVTDNQFNDFDSLLQGEFAEQFTELDAEVSVIAMSEVDFEVQPIAFADKVFFADQ